ncbi:hypothetical protein NQ314_008831 [Rhamnusium bicolor]|uniref:DDE Tnp4 domain-containing protein n=1 Tax=Rhamnusium bicolor TaxID=1586634 RepID=A0AAV8Y6V5_9CUCU|nr:hypothetical protein NQ314_008831 [Rhamnusium bicolor]
MNIVLLALVDDNYCVSYIDVGSNGRSSDGGIFANSSLKKMLENRTHNIPENSVVVGDEAFALKTYMMRPYPFRGVLDRKKRIFNYRLSRARRVSEKFVGILVSRFRLLEKPISLHPDKVDLIIVAICSIHNWLRKTSNYYIRRDSVDTEDINTGEIIPGTWRSELNDQSKKSLRQMGSNNYSRRAEEIRNQYVKYFNGDGSVS